MKKKRYVIAALAALLSLGLISGATFAYFTDNENTTNTLTVGKIDIDLEEPSWPGNDSDETKELVPNEKVPKDPQVKNVGINDAIIYVTFNSPLIDCENCVVNDDGSAYVNNTSEPYIELIRFYKNGEEGFSDKWTILRHERGVYLAVYNEKVPAGGTTDAIFDTIQIRNVKESLSEIADQIDIGAYAIQADYVLEDNIDLTKVFDNF